MIIKVKLNDLSYRYDVFQMIKLFHYLDDIDFVEENFDYSIEINEDKIIIGDNKEKVNYDLSQDDPIKEQLKKAVYSYFKEVYGITLPWGTLVGIRPSKIALELLEKGMKEEAIINYFYDHYMASKEKAQLCIDIARNENKFVNSDSNSISVYIGMPFCPTRCLYCSFTSNPIGGNKKLVEPYLEALKLEIREMSRFIYEKGLTIESIYFGGGTPTAIEDEQFEDLMSVIYSNFIKNFYIKEFTVECGRPDSITVSKLSSMKKYGVSRISINPQTMNDETLKSIGRNHNSKDVEDKFILARELGFDNINMDVIVGLPGEGIEEVENTCERLLKLKPDSLTVHGMSIKRASRLYEDLCLNKKYTIASQLELNEMYGLTRKLAIDLSMIPYYMYRQKNMVGNMENIGYSHCGKECIYNIQMIEEKQTIIALGADAVSKVVFLDENRIERFPNVKDVREYTSRINEMIEKKKELLNTLY